MGYQARSIRPLFGGFDQRVADLAVGPNYASRFGDAGFGVDLGPVVVDQVFDAGAGGGFLAGFGGEDYVAVERDVLALEEQHGHQAGGYLPLVVLGAAAVDVAVLEFGAERRDAPLGRVHLHGVGVAHQQNGPLRAVAFVKPLHQLSLEELRVRGAQSLHSLLERRGWSSLAKLPTDQDFLQLLDSKQTRTQAGSRKTA